MTNTNPIEKKLTLKAPVEKAFRHFTENIHAWWPMKSHSLSLENAEKVVFEGKEGGRLYEITDAGKEREWGVVKVYKPFTQVIFSWVLEKPDRATEVEVNFASTGADTSAMTLTHRGWETRPEGAEWRGEYTQGWEGVLGAYRASLASAAA